MATATFQQRATGGYYPANNFLAIATCGEFSGSYPTDPGTPPPGASDPPVGPTIVSVTASARLLETGTPIEKRNWKVLNLTLEALLKRVRFLEGETDI